MRKEELGNIRSMVFGQQLANKMVQSTTIGAIPIPIRNKLMFKHCKINPAKMRNDEFTWPIPL